MAALKPDLLIWHMKENPGLIFTNALNECEDWWHTSNPDGEVLYIGTPWVSFDTNSTLTMDQNRTVRGVAVANQRAYVDLMQPAVSYPWPAPAEFSALQAEPAQDVDDAQLQDRARYGLYPPGSSFKLVTAISALRKDPGLARQRYGCIRLPDGRTGNYVGQSKRPIRDDVQDREPHGSVDMERGIVVSCNAYFAQLGAYKVGARGLFDTASLFGIQTASPNKWEELRKALPQASYGQGQVVVSPFQMARVVSAIANGGTHVVGVIKRSTVSNTCATERRICSS